MILGIRGGTHPMSASSAGDEPGHLNQVDTSKQELLDAILIILSYLVIFSNIVSYFVIFCSYFVYGSRCQFEVLDDFKEIPEKSHFATQLQNGGRRSPTLMEPFWNWHCGARPSACSGKRGDVLTFAGIIA